MGAVISGRDLERFTPEWRAPEETPPVYLIAPLTLRERAAWQRDLTRSGATWHSDADVLAAVREAVREAAPDNEAEVLGAIDQLIGALADNPAAMTPPEGEDDPLAAARAAYAPVEAVMRSHPSVASLIADRGYFNMIAPMLAAAHALRGWEGIDVPFRRERGLVPEDVLERLKPEDMAACGWRAMALFRVGDTDAKN